MDITDPDVPARHWWSWVLRGLAAILFGVLALVLPGMTLVALIALFGAYALIAGFLSIVSALRHHGEVRRWWVLLIEGLVSIAAGVITAIYPGLTGLALLYLIAVWAIVTGVLQIVAGIEWRKTIARPVFFFLGGAASIVFGVLALVFPVAGALGIVWLIGVYAIVFGTLLIAVGLAFRGAPGWVAGGKTQPV